MLVREQLARAPESRLYLVEHQQHVSVVAEIADLPQVVVGRHAHAALALDRLEEHKADVRRDRRIESGDVVEGHIGDSGKQRLKSLVILRLARGRDGGQRAAMERVVGRNDAGSRGAFLGPVPPRELHTGLVRFGPAVAEEPPLRERVFREQPSQLDLRLDVVEVGHVHQRLRLLAHGLGNGRVAVSQVRHGNSCEEIQIFPAVRIPQARPFAACQRQLTRAIGVDDVLIVQGPDFLRVHVERPFPVACPRGRIHSPSGLAQSFFAPFVVASLLGLLLSVFASVLASVAASALASPVLAVSPLGFPDFL